MSRVLQAGHTLCDNINAASSSIGGDEGTKAANKRPRLAGGGSGSGGLPFFEVPTVGGAHNTALGSIVLVNL